jgi:putative spermidine/putrescine transport system substrate-binding protein
MLASTRRHLLASGAGAIIAAAGTRHAAAQELRPIRVTHFGGPYAALQGILAAPFEAARLGRVTYETENSVSANAKLQAGRADPPFDVAMLSRGITLRAAAAGLVTPLPMGRIPAAAGLVSGSVAPGNMGVAMLLDSVAIMYDRTKVAQPITSWLDLWRPELRGQIALPSASLPIYLTLMAVARAVANDTTKPESFDAAFAKLRELKPAVRVFYSDPVQASQMMERGEIAAAVQFTGRMPPVIRAPSRCRPGPHQGRRARRAL